MDLLFVDWMLVLSVFMVVIVVVVGVFKVVKVFIVVFKWQVVLREVVWFFYLLYGGFYMLKIYVYLVCDKVVNFYGLLFQVVNDVIVV